VPAPPVIREALLAVCCLYFYARGTNRDSCSAYSVRRNFMPSGGKLGKKVLQEVSPLGWVSRKNRSVQDRRTLLLGVPERHRELAFTQNELRLTRSYWFSAAIY
jgi:hypothetical protein